MLPLQIAETKRTRGRCIREITSKAQLRMVETRFTFTIYKMLVLHVAKTCHFRTMLTRKLR
jgi:hypothetical protein